MAAYEVLPRWLSPAELSIAAGCGLTLGHTGLQFVRLEDKGFKGGGWGMCKQTQARGQQRDIGIWGIL